MVAQMQLNVPLDKILFAFKFKEKAPYRYYNADTKKYSKTGYLAQIINIGNPEEEWTILKENGYTELLDGTTRILVLDETNCSILDAGNTLRRLAFRMN